MPRPRCHRRIGKSPRCCRFNPDEIESSGVGEVILSPDEVEGIRLADLEGMYHEKASESMGISRQTFGRIIESARKKVAEALVEGKILKIEQGDTKMTAKRTFKCHDCEHEWQVAFGTTRPEECPSCKSKNFHRAESEKGFAGGGHMKRNRGGRCIRDSKTESESK